MRRKLLISFVTLAAILAAPLAQAHTWTTLDADDSAGPLDLVYARLRHRHARIVVKVGTYETWGSDVLQRTQTNERRFVAVEFDTPATGGLERSVVVTTENGELVARMYGTGFAGDPMGEPVATVAVHRPDEHAVTVRFPSRLLGGKTTEYEWRAVTSFEAPGDPNCPKPEGPYDGGYGQCADFTGAATERKSS